MSSVDTDESLSEDGGEEGRWGFLALVGAMTVCCLSLTVLAGGAAVTGGTAAGVTAATGVVSSLGGILLVGLVTVLPLLVIGVVLRRRTLGS